LSSEPDTWWKRGDTDRSGIFPLYYRGKLHSFEELARLRSKEVEKDITPEVMAERHAANQKGIAALAATLAEAAPDVVVIIGDDQRESFLDNNMPTFAVYRGATVDNIPFNEADQKTRLGGSADWGHKTPEPTTNPCVPELADHLIKQCIRDEFDVAVSNKLTGGRYEGISHAFGFVYRRIMNDEVIPHVPVYINTFFAPNQPTHKRCYEFGQEIGKAIESWDSDKTVAVIASGGLSHYVVEEDYDHALLDALLAEDGDKLRKLPEELYDGGSSEARNWIATAGVMAGSGLHPDLVDYVPCYRSEGGTGNAMGFMRWK
jgi:hypothetical protein